MYPSLRYIQNTFKIQCILTLRYMTHSRIRHTYLEPYLRPGCISSPWMNFRIWDTCISSCISDVSRRYVSWLPLQIHVSHMYPACIMHLRYVPIRIHLRYMYHLMYLWSIPHVSLMYPDCILKCRQDASKIHVSWFCISVYLDVSWWRVLEDTCILMSWCILICIQSSSEAVWHQGSA